MGRGVHFLLIRNLNRTMWEFFFPAVIFKNASYDFLMRINSIGSINISYCCDIRFPQFLCRHIVFRIDVRFEIFVPLFSRQSSVDMWRESCAECGVCIVLCFVRCLSKGRMWRGTWIENFVIFILKKFCKLRLLTSTTPHWYFVYFDLLCTHTMFAIYLSKKYSVLLCVLYVV